MRGIGLRARVLCRPVRDGLGGKVEHKGFDLWLGCMAKKPDDWATMERYNKHDVVLLEQVYERLQPWIKNHPNRSVYEGHPCCPNCGSERSQSRGFAVAKTMRYQRLQCLECGTWHRKQRAEPSAEKRLAL